MKRFIVCCALMVGIFITPVKSYAGSSLEIVLWDSLLGASIGALVGAATLAFMEHPRDHLDRLAQGASIGLICGIGFGVYEISPMFYTINEPGRETERVYGLNVRIPLQ